MPRRAGGYTFATVLAEAGGDVDLLGEVSPDYRCEVGAMRYSRVYPQVLSLLQGETFGATSGAGV